MKRVFGLVALFGTASSVAVAAAPVARATKASTPVRKSVAIALLAPADEYFGPLKESVIGINLAIRNLGWNYDVNHDIGDKTFASAGLTERAIRDWERKYPHDDQLPHSVFLLQRLYTKILTQPSRDRAQVVANWLFADFAKSPQARQLHKTLIAEHLAPIPSPTPTPSPTPAYPSLFGPAYPSLFQATPAPAPSPSVVPSGALVPTPATH